MAQPIDLGVVPRDPREELRRRLEQAPQQHAEALLDSYSLLQELHDSGVLKLLRGALGSSDRIIETAVDAAKSEQAIRGMRNAIIMCKMMGSIDPSLLQDFANAVGQTLGSRKPAVKPPGLFRLIADFRRPKLRRSIALINTFLEAFGSQLDV